MKSRHKTLLFWWCIVCSVFHRFHSEVFVNQFLKTYETWASTCAIAHSSPWSLSNVTYNNHSHSKLVCERFQDLEASLKTGARVFPRGMPDTTLRTQIQNSTSSVSYFQPATCGYEWLSSQQICDISNKYQHIYLLGDSLLRHVTQGMMMLLTDDWKTGGLSKYRNVTGSTACHCDGQFSDLAECRTYVSRDSSHCGSQLNDLPECKMFYSFVGRTFSFEFSSPAAYGICSANHSFALLYSNLELPDLCSVAKKDDTRPQLIILGAGLHYQCHSEHTLKRFVQVFYNRLKEQRSKCPHKIYVHIIWTSLTYQSRILDHKYPHQSNESAIAFNLDMNHKVRLLLRREVLMILDFMSLTTFAGTSDGIHSLSEVNLLKAQYIFNAMRILTM